jgi:NADPH-dependent 2,4-dienoyl-CoA reductase/sulfur reductase-like enzyme
MTMRYDRLVIVTGAKPVRPDLPGGKLEACFCRIRWISFVVHRYLAERNPRAAVLVGAGYICLEMATLLPGAALK